MCRSLAEGGRHCRDLKRLASREIISFAPDPAPGVEDVAWRSDEQAMARTLARRREAVCWALTLLDEVRHEEPEITAAVMKAASAANGH